MSDETVNFETNNPGSTASGTATGATPGAGPEAGPGTAERVGFCQDCGTPLTRDTARPVGAGVFCEPCLAARVGTADPYSPGMPPADALTGTPHPVLAALLGIIPGVGAMYNGQYAKGIAHLVITVVLSHLGHFFELLGFIWWIYQVVDAYQTAKARLEGRPLPNPFGLNEIGERMGFGRTWGNIPPNPAGATPPPYGTAPPSYADASQTYASASQTYTGGVPYTGPVSHGPDWVGYVPPTNFATAPPVPPAAQPGYAPAYTQAYTGGAPSYAAVPVVPASPLPVSPLPPAKRFPVGAMWLIGLGLVFLIGEFAPEWGWDWHLNPNWLLVFLFAGLSAWTFTRRLSTGERSICGLRWPVILGVLAVLFAIQALEIASLGRTWPVLFIAFGVMLILERTALGHPAFEGAPYGTSSFVPPISPEADAAEARTRAAWTAPATPETPIAHEDDDATKGGL